VQGPPNSKQKINKKITFPDIYRRQCIVTCTKFTSDHNIIHNGRLVAYTWVKLSTDLQILGCELHKKAFGRRAPLGPAGQHYHSAKPL